MISWIRLAAAGASRRRLRTLVTATGVALAVAALCSLLAFQRGYQNGLRGELERLGAHLLVVPKGCPYDAASIALHGASWPCYLDQAYLATVRRTTHVAVAAPVLMNAVYDSASGAQAVYCGIDASMRGVKRAWRIDGAFPSVPGDLLVGSERAREGRWQVGQRVDMPGLPGRSGRVSGILAPTQGAEDLFIYLRLQDAQRMFRRPGQLTHMLVRLDDPENSQRVVDELRGCGAGLEMNVVPLAHLFQTIQNLVQSTRLLLGCVALVALLAAGAGVSSTVLMAVAERTREIGVLRALGATRAMVFRLIWAETAVLCLAGGAAGLGAALLGGRLVESWIRARLPFVPSGPLMQIEAPVLAACMAATLVVGTVACLLPAWQAASLAPSRAIRAS